MWQCFCYSTNRWFDLAVDHTSTKLQNYAHIFLPWTIITFLWWYHTRPKPYATIIYLYACQQYMCLLSCVGTMHACNCLFTHMPGYCNFIWYNYMQVSYLTYHVTRLHACLITSYSMFLDKCKVTVVVVYDFYYIFDEVTTWTSSYTFFKCWWSIFDEVTTWIDYDYQL
jgi:hypothetical protein